MDPDLPLVRALQSGDDSALNELMTRHEQSLFRFVLRLVGEECTAAEIVQETFVRVYFGARSFRPRAAVKTWLYSIALNLGRDHLRKRKVRAGVSFDGPNDYLKNEVTDSNQTAVERVSVADDLALLQSAIDELPHKLREALVLFSLEGKSQRETAQILKTSPKTVELRVYRAKLRLRQLLEKIGH